MPTNKLIAAILRQATARGSRSTVLKPLGWLAGICATALLGALRYNATPEVIHWILIFLGATILLYLAAYVYCLLTDKEALRTETYLIQKTAIEKGYVGDTLAGIFQIESDENDSSTVNDPSGNQES
jgi:hypothetical protein